MSIDHHAYLCTLLHMNFATILISFQRDQMPGIIATFLVINAMQQAV